MNQLSEEQQERLKQIREIVNGPNFYYQGQFYKSRDDQQFLGDALLLLQETFSLLDSDSRVVEDNELDDIKAIRARAYNSIQFSADTYMHDVRRLLHLYPQLNDRTATAMRDKCVETLKAVKSKWAHKPVLTHPALDEAISALESLNFDQVKPEKQ